MRQSDPYQPSPYVTLEHPEWSVNATIYQINTRQFTEEGTFRAAEEHLPRLKELGAVILWLMPIHAIGQKNLKGSLGSPYAVKDYYSVNPEFGSLYDLKHYVHVAHELDMHVILGWVANNTATFDEHLYHGMYTEYFGQESVELDGSTRLELEPWGFRVFVQR